MKTTLLLLLALVPSLFAQEADAGTRSGAAQVQFTLSDVLHTVRGAFKLKRGFIHYDFATGKASGEFVIDAQSGDSGSGARDRRMNKNVLESDKYPEIVFVPDHVEGSLARANVHGQFRIHGADHEMTMIVAASPSGGKLDIRTQFAVPYVQSGSKTPARLS